MAALPFESAILNYVFWLAGPVSAMKGFLEAEKRSMNGFRHMFRAMRWMVAVVWAAAAVFICISIKSAPAGDGISDIVGYIMGLVATVLVWRLHTTVHRGLVQLWRYTKVL